jgi:hypothetical protein
MGIHLIANRAPCSSVTNRVKEVPAAQVSSWHESLPMRREFSQAILQPWKPG